MTEIELYNKLQDAEKCWQEILKHHLLGGGCKLNCVKACS